MRPTWRHRLGLASLTVLALTAAAPTSALGQDPADERPIVGSPEFMAAGDSAPAGGRTITLITGDQVLVAGAGTDSPVVTVLPRADGTVPLVEIRRVGDDVYALPVDAADAIAAGTVDEELFNVTGLVAMGYDDESTATLRVIATYTEDIGTARSAPATPRGATTGKTLRSIDAVALRADKAQARRFWIDATSESTAAGTAIEKIWLDRLETVSLEESTTQVNAPQVWASGLTGEGTTVAVLDTGADGEHPDLAGRIVASQDFTASPGGALSDLHGHGTHTASTVGGSGAASDGGERGVAPGTGLLIAKVLGDNGGGYDSGIIAGMEWAVAQDADVVSMSLGSTAPPGDCTDPLSSAAQALATSGSSLFVVAAGNTGSANNTVTAPACAPAVLTVGAVDADDESAWFSSRGPAATTHTLKPEIAAPGVGILAARAGGRGADAYVGMSGTSMATPHVAGAAALVQQAHPAWTGARLKEALVSSASSAIPADVRAAGAGRLDALAAVNGTVLSGPVQAGTFDWPHTSDEATTVEVPYTNVSPEPVTLQLSIAGIAGDDGSAVSSAPVALGASSVTVPAGETVQVPLRVNPAARLDAGQYGDVTGRIVATGDAAVSTPFSLYVEPQTVELTVRMTNRLGRPASNGSSVDVVNTDSITAVRAYNSGAPQQTFRVRPGNYLLSGFVTTPDAGTAMSPPVSSIAYFARPQLKVTGDMTVDLDATKAHQLTTKTDRTSAARTSVLSFSRTWDDTWMHSGAMVGGSSLTGVYADIQGTVKDGTWEFGNWSRRYAPFVESMSVVGGPVLHPVSADMTQAGLDGTGQAPLVDAGAGTAADLTAARVGGKVALVRVASANDGLTTGMVNAARAAGAKALLLSRPVPGRWSPSMGFNPVTVAAYALPMEEADLLTSLLAEGGEVALQWKATAKSPFVYNLGFTQSTPITEDKTWVVRDKFLGRTEADYTAMGLDIPFRDSVYAGRADGVMIGVSSFDAVPEPGHRTELYTDGGTRWVHEVRSSFPFGEAMADNWRTYPAGSVRTEEWHRGIIAPAAIKDGEGVEQLTAERQGGLMGFAPRMWGDDHGHTAYQGSFGDEGRMELRRNGELIGTSWYPFGVFDVPAEAARYELMMVSGKYGSPARSWARSTEIRTTWGFDSVLEPDVFSRGLPLLFPRVGLPEDGMKTLAPTGGQVLPIRVTGHGGYTPGDLVTARFAWSYDGGSTWTDAPVRQVEGGWSAVVDHSGASGRTVTTRVELTDSLGATVTQVVQAAYAVR